MQPIERYGVVALLFLIATIAAVVLWDRAESEQALAGAGGRGTEVAALPEATPPAPAPRRGARSSPSLSGGLLASDPDMPGGLPGSATWRPTSSGGAPAGAFRWANLMLKVSLPLSMLSRAEETSCPTICGC